jgi:hypothetical protein
MNRTRAGILLLAVQLVLVLSVAGNYAYERRTRPRVWVRTTQFDPNMPLRGRYLALQLQIDACGLARDAAHLTPGFNFMNGHTQDGRLNWNASLAVRDGKLIAVAKERPRSPAEVEDVSIREHGPCDRAILQRGVDYFIPDTARGPFPLKPGQELWVEVTVPATGPPRPIQLALSDASGFHPLKLE